MPADVVVRRDSSHVPDGRQLIPGRVVGSSRQHGVYWSHVVDQSRLHCRLCDVVQRRRGTVRLRYTASHVQQHLHQRTSQDLPLQPDWHTRLPDGQLPDEISQEMAWHHQTKAGRLSSSFMVRSRYLFKIIKTATRSCRTRKRAFHFCSSGVRRRHAAALPLPLLLLLMMMMLCVANLLIKN